MAVVCTLSNHFKYQRNAGNIDLRSAGDTIIAILMNTTFAFDKRTHATLADVTADQLSTGHGYTQDTKALTNLSLSEDDVNDRAVFTCDDLSWTGSGGSIGPTGSMCLIDTDTADDTCIGCVDFGADFTIVDGYTFPVENIEIEDV